MKISKIALRTNFKRGLKPLQETFYNWFDSYWHKDELIDIDAVKDLKASLDNKLDNSAQDTLISAFNDALKEASFGLKGKATPTTVPTAYSPATHPDGLYEKYDVEVAGTFVNFFKSDGQPVIITADDLQGLVQITVSNGVAEKSIKDLPQASVNVRIWEDLQPNDFPLNEGAQVIFENSHWMVDKLKTTSCTDVPSEDSLIWVSIGGSGSKVENLEKAARSFLNGGTTDIVEYNSTNAIKGSLKADGTIVGQGTDAYNKIIQIDLVNAFHVKITAHPFQTALPEYAMFVGTRDNGQKVVLLSGQLDSSFLQTFDVDVADFVSGQICYNYTANESSFKVRVSVPGFGAQEDGIKLYIDKEINPINKVLKDFVEGSPVYADIEPFVPNNEVVASLENNNTQPVGNTNARSVININTNGKKFFHYEALRPREDLSNINTYPALLGIKSNGDKTVLIPASLQVNNEGLYSANINIEAFTKISYCRLNGINPNFFFHNGITEMAISENAVKDYINATIISGSSGKLDLYSLGFRENKSEAENTAIFNQAFAQAKAQKKHIQIPGGAYAVGNVQMKSGVGFTGDDKNTILRTSAGKDVFIYPEAEAQSYIEANQLGANEYVNQGIEIGHFILSGNGVGKNGMTLNQMAYSNFERIYHTGFTGHCMDLKGVLLCNFYDIQFTKSVNGIKSNISDNGTYWTNLNNFYDCKWRFISGIALDWAKGAGLNLTGCDLSAIGTTNNLNTGVIRLRDMSQEDIGNGIKGVDLTMTNCWGEQLYGGFYLDIDQSSLGKTIINNCPISRSPMIGTMQNGILNKGSKVMFMNSQFNGLDIKTSNNGITKILNVDGISGHTETSGGQYVLIG